MVAALVVVGPATQALAGAAYPGASGTGEPQLRVSGTAASLIPGHPVTVHVRITNPQDSAAAVRILLLTATVSDGSAACTADNVRVSSYRWTPAGRSYATSPGTSVVVPLTMSLVETGANQDACQGARFPLHFNVQAAAA